MGAPDPGRTALYRLYDAAGRLLYVGITSDIKRRWSQHEHDKTWWPFVARKETAWHRSRKDALAAETRAIKEGKPLHNRCLVTQRVRAVPRRSYEEVRKAEARVMALIRKDIADGVYEPGLRLSRPELAERYGVAIIIITFALGELGRARVLEERKNRYYVPRQP